MGGSVLPRSFVEGGHTMMFAPSKLIRARQFVGLVALLTGSIVVPALPQHAYAASAWFVATIGSDANDCMSEATACQTVSGAIAKASAGDIINIAGGTYADRLILSSPVTLVGASASSTIVTATSGE